MESVRTDDSRSLLGRGGEKDGQGGRVIKGGLVLFFQDKKDLSMKDEQAQTFEAHPNFVIFLLHSAACHWFQTVEVIDYM